MAATLIERLLRSDQPSIRWAVRSRVLGENPDSASMRRLRASIRRSEPVRRLLHGYASLRPAPYAKWQGGHWVLLSLAELGYPPGDDRLAPTAGRVVRQWLAPRYFRESVPEEPDQRPETAAVALIAGRYRRCASQQAGALLATVRLGIAEPDQARLAERLLHWQWPDGGWNCDRDPAARSSSVYETLLPMRALAAYAARTGDAAAGRAAGVLLERRLLYHRSTGRPIRRDWLKLHFPIYWHYDLLAGLKGLAEAGLIGDRRCRDALDLLESKRLPGGGWPVEARFHRGASAELRTAFDHYDWGRPGDGRINEWVTADALFVLSAAGRLQTSQPDHSVVDAGTTKGFSTRTPS